MPGSWKNIENIYPIMYIYFLRGNSCLKVHMETRTLKSGRSLGEVCQWQLAVRLFNLYEYC